MPVSYDGDEAPTKPELPHQNAVAEPVQVPASTEYASFPSNDTQQAKPEPSDGIPVKDEPMYGNGQNGDSGPAWNTGHGGQNQYNDGAMNHEPPPIGIKEDG